MILLISSLSLTLYLNSMAYDRKIFGSSPKVFGNLQKSLEIFRFTRQSLNDLRTKFEQSSAIFGKRLEIFRKSSNSMSSLCLYKKKHYTVARRYEFYVF